MWRQTEERIPPGGPVERLGVWEYRYGSARERYLVRELDPETLEPIPGGDTWSDYAGDSVYADYTVAQGGAVTELTRHRPGHWQHDSLGSGTMFYHANHLGTTRTLTDDAGDVLGNASRLYTAFGVPVTAPTTPLTRHGFAGAWGYQSPSAASVGSPESSGLLHVGARYYDPALGRFLQRDPVGIAGGLNVYAYVGNSPLLHTDPAGLHPRGALELGAEYKGLRSLGLSPSEASQMLGDLYGPIGGGLLDSIIPFTDPFAESGMYDPNSPQARLGRALGLGIGGPLRAINALKWLRRLRALMCALRPDNPVWKAPQGIYDAFKYSRLAGGSPVPL
ncbi:MAG: RHS repeat-associated core domain-containing protein [bacterium]|nr:RHS repeat-associated core domain-containing protein [bacterium]